MNRKNSAYPRRLLLMIVACFLACTSMSTPPPAAKLPPFAFHSLRGQQVQIVVLDQRAGDRDPKWSERLRDDVRSAFSSSGAHVTDAAAPITMEVRLLLGRSDFENRQWKGCVSVSGRVLGAATPVSSSGEACVAKANLWGKATADNVLRLAYEDALVKLLSDVDSRL
jgi:hypothetical protein